MLIVANCIKCPIVCCKGVFVFLCMCGACVCTYDERDMHYHAALFVDVV